MPKTTEELRERLRNLHATWIAHGWSWDRRFECVASTIAHEHGPSAMQLVGDALPDRWTRKTLARAPDVIADLAQATGGVRDDQILFATPDAPIVAYGLWWPWGGESSNISVRVGLTGRVGYDDHFELRKIFNALDD